MAEKTRRYNPQDDVFSLIDGKRVPVRGYNIAQPSPKKKPAGPDLSMEFDGQKLTLQVNTGGKVVRHSVPAVSGRPDGEGAFAYDKARQQLSNQGPIPEGKHLVEVGNVQRIANTDLKDRALRLIGRGKWPGGEYAWGKGRVEIFTPAEIQHQNNGRRGFTIHGGSVPGSAGCIDVVGNDEKILNLIEKYRGNNQYIPLTVDYSRTPKKVYYGGKK